MFNLRYQEEEEALQAFIMTVCTLARHCGYGTIKKRTYKGQDCCGNKGEKWPAQLQLDPDLTVAIANVRMHETVAKP